MHQRNISWPEERKTNKEYHEVEEAKDQRRNMDQRSDNDISHTHSSS